MRCVILFFKRLSNLLTFQNDTKTGTFVPVFLFSRESSILKIRVLDLHKKIAFLIAIKRFKRNSVLLKGPAYKISSLFGLSPQTFKKYVREMVQDGYLVESPLYYTAIPFSKAVQLFAKETGLYVGQHTLLKGEHNFKKILLQLQEALIVDNVIKRQEFKIKQKKEFLYLLNVANGTVKRDTPLSRKQYSTLKKISKGAAYRAQLQKSLNNETINVVISSCRHISRTIGVSPSKASDLLAKSTRISRRIHTLWFDGLSEQLVDSLREKYPKALIYPLFSLGKVKVSFGSELRLRN